MTKYLVYIEEHGDAITKKGPVAHVPSLPGASVRGQTVAEAKEKVKDAIASYLTLLRDVGEPVPRASDGIFLEFQEVDSTTFPTDYDTLHPNEMEALFRWMAISRQEMVDLVKSLPEEALHWKPDWDDRTVSEILCHISEADLWFTDRLKQWPEAPLFRLAATRGMALERLRGLTEAERTSKTVHEGEEWTPRKVVRRMLEHEREHINQLKALIAARQAEQEKL